MPTTRVRVHTSETHEIRFTGEALLAIFRAAGIDTGEERFLEIATESERFLEIATESDGSTGECLRQAFCTTTERLVLRFRRRQ